MMRKPLIIALILMSLFMFAPSVLACHQVPPQSSLIVTVTFKGYRTSGEWVRTIKYIELPPKFMGIVISTEAYREIFTVFRTNGFCAPYDKTICKTEDAICWIRTYHSHGYWRFTTYTICYHLTITVTGVPHIKVYLATA